DACTAQQTIRPFEQSRQLRDRQAEQDTLNAFLYYVLRPGLPGLCFENAVAFSSTGASPRTRAAPVERAEVLQTLALCRKCAIFPGAHFRHIFVDHRFFHYLRYK